MDAKQNTKITGRISTIPRIRRSAEWVAARPSAVLHLALAGAWLLFLASLPSTDPDSTAPLGFVDGFAAAMAFVTTVGIFAVVFLALRNSKITAPATSAWGPDAVLAAAIVAASAAIMSRRDTATV